MKLSQRVLRMKESATLQMAKKARALRAKGIDVINLSLGEPDFDTPQHIRDAAKAGLDQGYTRYTPVNGLLELREAIVKKLERDNHLSYTVDQIVVSNGAKQSIANVFWSILDPEDEVIVLAPYWVSYVAMIKVTGGIPVILPSTVEEDFKVPAHRIEEAITSKTKAIIFSSPSNPTGSVWNREEFQQLAEVIQRHPNILVVADEIYEYINYGDRHLSFASIEGMSDRTVTINGFSKGFAMTGWRLGYLAAPLQIAQACTKVQGQYTSGANAFGQYAGSVALTSDLSPTHEMKQAYLERKKLILEMVADIPSWKCTEPEGAFYIFPDVSACFGKTYGQYQINDANDLVEYLLMEAHVATVSGSAFGAPECLRISFAASNDQIIRAMKAITLAIKELS